MDLLSIWTQLLSGLRLLQLRPAQRLAELILILRSRGELPLCNAVQYGLAVDSGKLTPFPGFWLPEQNAIVHTDPSSSGKCRLI
jgi:hypothetical protein